MKLVIEAGTDRLLGAHIVSANAGDIIGEAVLAVRFGLSTRDVVSTLHPYLTWNEGLKLAAQTFTKGCGEALLLRLVPLSGKPLQHAFKVACSARLRSTA